MITAFRKEIRQLISIFFVSLVLISCSKQENIDSIPPDPAEFIDYSIDGVNHSYVAPSDTIGAYIPLPGEFSSFFYPSLRVHSTGQDGNFSVFVFRFDGVGVNSNHKLNFFGTTSIFGVNNPLFSENPVTVHITEYGQVGEHIAGNFQGVLVEGMHPSLVHSISCSFRVRRTF